MRTRSLLLLVLLVAGLGAVLWFTDEKPAAKKIAETTVLDGRSLMNAKSIHWQFYNREPIELTRTPEGFRITEPTDDVVSAAYLRNIVVAWDTARMQAAPLPDTPQNREKNGFSPPELVFGVTWPDGRTIDVSVGGVGPLSDKQTRYLLRDDKLWVGDSALIECLRVGLDDLREHVVFRNLPDEVGELKVEQLLASGTRDHVHLKVVDRAWRLLAPVDARAEPVAAQQFVTAVMSLRVSDFVPGVVVPPSTDPAIVIEVTGRRGQETLRLWQEQGQIWGLLPGRNVWFSSDNNQYVGIFTNAAQLLRARILLPLREGAFEQLEEIVVDPGEGHGDRMRLARPSAFGQWRIVEPVEMQASPTACNEAAQALQMLVVAEFVDEAGAIRPRADDPRYGLKAGTGRATVTVKVAKETKPTTLWFGKSVARPEEPLVYACRADDPDAVGLVGQAHVDALSRPWVAYCNLRVLDLGAVPVERLVLKHKDGRQRVYLSDGKQWVREGIDGARPDVRELVTDHLRDLRGTQAVDVRGAQFATPDWTISLQRQDKDELGALRVWDRGADAPLLLQGSTPGGSQGSSQGSSPAAVAFEVKDLVGRALRALWQ